MGKIEWRPWDDPLQALLSDTDGDEYGGGVLTEDGPKPFGGSGPMLIGPLGLIPLREGNVPSRLFNFWMAHCDFDLTRDALDRICGAPGVETLDCVTRYRCRVGIGKAFDEDEVKARIDALFAAPVSLSGMDAVEELAAGSHEHWAAYKDGLGVLHLIVGDTEKEVRDRWGEAKAVAKDARYSW